MLHNFFNLSGDMVYLMAMVTPLALMFILGPWTIRKLRELKAGQPVREAHGNVHAPDHAAKAGTPTMGVFSAIFAVDIGVRSMCLACNVCHGFSRFP